MLFEIKTDRINCRSVGKLCNKDNFEKLLSSPEKIDELILRFLMLLRLSVKNIYISKWIIQNVQHKNANQKEESFLICVLSHIFQSKCYLESISGWFLSMV